MQPPEARRDSKGNLYAFIPNKGGHQIRRLSEDGKIVPRIRMSKKTRCKIRRVVKDFHVTQDRASDLRSFEYPQTVYQQATQILYAGH